MSIFRLREIRESKSVSVKQLSVATGLSTDAIRSIESGLTRNPRKETLKALADYFNINVNYLYTNGVKPKKEKYRSGVSSTDNMQLRLMARAEYKKPTEEVDFNKIKVGLKELEFLLKSFIVDYEYGSLDRALSKFNTSEFDCLVDLNRYFNSQIQSKDFISEKLYTDILNLFIEDLIVIYNHLVDIRSKLIDAKSEGNDKVVKVRTSVLTNCSNVSSIIDFVNTYYLMKFNIPYATRCIDSKFVSISDE